MCADWEKAPVGLSIAEKRVPDGKDSDSQRGNVIKLRGMPRSSSPTKHQKKFNVGGDDLSAPLYFS